MSRKRPRQLIADTYDTEGVGGVVAAALRWSLVDPVCRAWNGRPRTERPVVWVHIGAHKTGTTTIQDCLRRQQYRLRRHSVRYLRYGYQLAGRLMRASPLPEAERARVADELGRMLVEQPQRVVLLSAESFCGDPYSGYPNVEAVSADLRRLLAGFDVRIVAVVRRQDRFVESLYQQYVKGGRSATFPEFARQCDFMGFDWNRVVDAYVAQFGRERVRVHLFERLFESSDRLVERLFAGGERQFRCPCGPGRRSNPGLSPRGFEVLRRANAVLERDESRRLRRWLEAEFERRPGERLPLFSDAGRRGPAHRAPGRQPAVLCDLPPRGGPSPVCAGARRR